MFKVVLVLVLVGILFLMFRRLVWRLWKREGDQALPKGVAGPLTSQFALEPDVLGRLRCRARGGRYMGQPVQYFGIFDPALLKGGPGGAATYKALLADRGALLFEARTWSSGIVVVEDRRAGQAAF